MLQEIYPLMRSSESEKKERHSSEGYVLKRRPTDKSTERGRGIVSPSNDLCTSRSSAINQKLH